MKKYKYFIASFALLLILPSLSIASVKTATQGSVLGDYTSSEREEISKIVTKIGTCTSLSTNDQKVSCLSEVLVSLTKILLNRTVNNNHDNNKYYENNDDKNINKNNGGIEIRSLSANQAKAGDVVNIYGYNFTALPGDMNVCFKDGPYAKYTCIKPTSVTNNVVTFSIQKQSMFWSSFAVNKINTTKIFLRREGSSSTAESNELEFNIDTRIDSNSNYNSKSAEPDLIITEFNWSPSSPYATYTNSVTTSDGYVHFTIIIKNISNFPAYLPENTEINVKYKDSGTVVAGASLGVGYILQAGESKKYEITSTSYPNITKNPGVYELVATVDDEYYGKNDGLVAESDENNNSKTDKITIKNNYANGGYEVTWKDTIINLSDGPFNIKYPLFEDSNANFVPQVSKVEVSSLVDYTGVKCSEGQTKNVFTSKDMIVCRTTNQSSGGSTFLRYIVKVPILNADAKYYQVYYSVPSNYCSNSNDLYCSYIKDDFLKIISLLDKSISTITFG